MQIVHILHWKVKEGQREQGSQVQLYTVSQKLTQVGNTGAYVADPTQTPAERNLQQPSQALMNQGCDMHEEEELQGDGSPQHWDTVPPAHVSNRATKQTMQVTSEAD